MGGQDGSASSQTNSPIRLGSSTFVAGPMRNFEVPSTRAGRWQ
jgi:hypothetical protein